MRKKYIKFTALISIILCSNVHAYAAEEVPLEDQETQSKLIAFTTAQLEAVEMPDDVRDVLSRLGIDYNKTITFRNKKNENEIHAFIPSSDGGAVYIFTNGRVLYNTLNAERSKPYRQVSDMTKLLAQHLPLSHQSQVLNPPTETKNYDTLAAFYTSGSVGRQVLIGFNKVDEHATVYTRNPDGGWATSSLKISEADKKHLAQNANSSLLNSFIHNGVLVINNFIGGFNRSEQSDFKDKATHNIQPTSTHSTINPESFIVAGSSNHSSIINRPSSSAIKSSTVFPTESSVMPTPPIAASLSPGGPANSRALVVVPDTQESNSLGLLKQIPGSLLSSRQAVPRVPDKESQTGLARGSNAGALVIYKGSVGTSVIPPQSRLSDAPVSSFLKKKERDNVDGGQSNPFGPNKASDKQKLHQDEKHGSKHSGNGRRGLWSNLYNRWFTKRFDNKEDLLRAKKESDEEEERA